MPKLCHLSEGHSEDTLCRCGRYEPRKWIIPMTCRYSGTVGAGMSRMAATFSGSATIPSAVNL